MAPLKNVQLKLEKLINILNMYFYLTMKIITFFLLIY